MKIIIELYDISSKLSKLLIIFVASEIVTVKMELSNYCIWNITKLLVWNGCWKLLKKMNFGEKKDYENKPYRNFVVINTVWWVVNRLLTSFSVFDDSLTSKVFYSIFRNAKIRESRYHLLWIPQFLSLIELTVISNKLRLEIKIWYISGTMY